MRIRMFLVCCLIAGLCAGCATGYSSDRSDSSGASGGYGPEIAGNLRFDDLPVPSGFGLNRKESFIFQNDRTRLGTMTYVGGASLDDIIYFYKHNMEINGWHMINSVEYGRIILNFEKDSEGCIVTVEKKGMGKAVITLNISPVSKGRVVVEEESKE